MNAAQMQRLAVALRVVARAVSLGLVVDRPAGVLVYGAELETAERKWLIDGMESAHVAPVPIPSKKGEDREVVGYLLGRVYRLQVTTTQCTQLGLAVNA